MRGSQTQKVNTFSAECDDVRLVQSQELGFFLNFGSPMALGGCLHRVCLGLDFRFILVQRILRVDFLEDWFDLPAVQGTLKSLLQHHTSKASILQHSAFFTRSLEWVAISSSHA